MILRSATRLAQHGPAKRSCFIRHISSDSHGAAFTVIPDNRGVRFVSGLARWRMLRNRQCGDPQRPGLSRGVAKTSRSEAASEASLKQAVLRDQAQSSVVGGIPGDVEKASSSEVPGEDQAPKLEAKPKIMENFTNETVLPQVERLSKMYRRLQMSYITAGIGTIVILIGIGVVIFNWSFFRHNVSRESAEMVRDTIRDKQLQYDAREFSKELLNQLLTDEEVAKTVAHWINGILNSLKNEIGDLFVKILALEPVVQAVNRLADRLVEYLCANRTIQERVGQLLVNAICLDASRNATAQWSVDLVMREDVIAGFRDLVVAALQTDAVVGEARNLALQIVDTVLKNPGTQEEARRALNETLSNSELRQTAKDSLWSIVMPWGSRSRDLKVDPDTKALKSLDEVMVLESLTEEERSMLRLLQARVRAGPGSVAPSSPIPTPVAADPPAESPSEMPAAVHQQMPAMPPAEPLSAMPAAAHQPAESASGPEPNTVVETNIQPTWSRDQRREPNTVVEITVEPTKSSAPEVPHPVVSAAAVPEHLAAPAPVAVAHREAVPSPTAPLAVETIIATHPLEQQEIKTSPAQEPTPAIDNAAADVAAPGQPSPTLPNKEPNSEVVPTTPTAPAAPPVATVAGSSPAEEVLTKANSPEDLPPE